MKREELIRRLRESNVFSCSTVAGITGIATLEPASLNPCRDITKSVMLWLGTF